MLRPIISVFLRGPITFVRFMKLKEASVIVSTISCRSIFDTIVTDFSQQKKESLECLR